MLPRDSKNITYLPLVKGAVSVYPEFIMQLIQTLLHSENTAMLTFLPVDSRVKRGTVLSLKGDERRWTVEAQYMEVTEHSIQRLWGLDLPKSQRTEK